MNGHLHTPDRFNLGERASGTNWIRGWVDPRTGLDGVKREKSCPFRDSNSDSSAVQLVAIRYADRDIILNKTLLRCMRNKELNF
jgi:hypothetical protein